MRIERLQIQRWRCFEDQTFTIGAPRWLLVGAHGAGKSSVCDAIRWLLTGVCRGTDEGGRGVQRLVHRAHRGRPLVVTADIVHAGRRRRVTRRWDQTQTQLSVEGAHGALGDQQRALLKWLGVDKDVLTVLLDGTRFWSLGHGDAKGLLLAVMPCRIRVPGDPEEEISLAECEARYQLALESRRAAKKWLRDRPPLEAPPESAQHDLARLEAQLATDRAQRDRLLTQRAESYGRARAAYDAALAALERHQAVLARLRAQGAADAATRLAQVEAAWVEAQARVDAMRVPGPDEQGPSGVSVEAIDAVARAVQAQRDAGTGLCVVSDGLRCPLAPSAWAEEAARLEALLAQLEGARQATARRQEAVRAAEAECARLARERAEWQARLSAWEAASAAVAEAEAQVRAVADPGPRATEDDAIAALEARIAEGQQRLVTARRIAYQAGEAAARAADRLAAEAQLAEAEADVARYGPHGLRVAALADATTGWLAHLNRLLAPFGERATLDEDPFGLRVNDLPIVCLSVSEQFRVTVALQCALAAVTGVGFTIIDQLDLLLPEVRRAWTPVLVGDDLGLEQVVFARADTQMAPQTTGRLQINRLSP